MMEKGRAPVQIESRTLSGSAGTRGALRIEIEYPAVTGCACGAQLSAFYRRQAEAYYRACCYGTPRRQAEQQRALWKDDAPFEPLRAGRSFSVMYNGGGFLSIFSDSWEELGCAGSFLRRQAHTWELSSGRAVPAGRFFRRGSGWRQLAVSRISSQIEQWTAEQPAAFFADARQKCRVLHGFYLADDGMVFYYPAESLGPRALGIPSFLVRYSDFGGMLAVTL